MIESAILLVSFEALDAAVSDILARHTEKAEYKIPPKRTQVSPGLTVYTVTVNMHSSSHPVFSLTHKYEIRIRKRYEHLTVLSVPADRSNCTRYSGIYPDMSELIAAEQSAVQQLSEKQAVLIETLLAELSKEGIVSEERIGGAAVPAMSTKSEVGLDSFASDPHETADPNWRPWNGIKNLDAEHRQILELYLWEDYSGSEAAARLYLSERRIRNIVSELRRFHGNEKVPDKAELKRMRRRQR